MKISDILRRKGATVVTIAPDRTVRELVAALAEHRIGAIVVVSGDQVTGIASERDVVRALTTHGIDVMNVTIAQIMTTPVVSCAPDDSVDLVAETMTNRRIRHMPVINAGLVGIVSIGDVVLSRIDQLEQDRGQLEQYITG